MTGAYAHDWPGRGPWAAFEGRSGCGPQDEGRRGRGRRRSGRGGDFPVEALMGWALTRAKGPHGPRPEDLERLEEMIALRRMRGRGSSAFGRGRGPRGRGRRRRGDVRLAVLRLLAEEPRNGYGLMQTIEERSQGQWRPSPGSVYPTLSQLEDEGLIRSVETEDGRRYEITDAGRADLEARAGESDPWTPEPDADESAMSELGPLVFGIGKAVWQVASVGDDAQRARAAELLERTRRGLYGILAADRGDENEPTADDPEVPRA